MPPDLRLKAYAKINLGLRILGRREDGYHDIITVFQRISLADEVILKRLTGRVEYLGPALTLEPGDNLVVRAAEAFRRQFGNDLGAKIELIKQIPEGAGLGGGSSDAAAVLRGLAQSYDLPQSDPALRSLAAGLGADVPFFLEDAPAAMGRGIGDNITRCNGLDGANAIVIAYPGVAVSTRQAYEMMDKILTFDDNVTKLIIRQFLGYQGGMPMAEMTNDFERAIFVAHPESARGRDQLLAGGARSAGLCGSGSALFGIFDTETLGRAAVRGWSLPWLCFVCRPY